MEPHRDSRPGIRASDQDRDAVVQRLQVAFGEGRLTDEEFDDRMRAALAARTYADLDELLTDLPAVTTAAATPAAPVRAPRPGRQAIAYKNHIRLTGRWRVPARFRAIIYKGGGVLDLRAAELTAPLTTIRAIAYKSNLQIIVPPTVRLEINGIGVTRHDDQPTAPPPGAPIVHIAALAYKGLVEARTRPS